MSSEFPKLQKHLDEIRTRIDQVLKDEFIEKGLIEEVEFDFQTIYFVPRSSRSDVVLALQNILSDFAKISPKTTKPSTLKIDKKHIFAAESLLRMSRCKDLAVRVLILGLDSDVVEVAELASKALGEIKEYRKNLM